jgi:hypothetical protein
MSHDDARSAAGRLARTVENFDDPSQEWRRLFSELFGTFLLVLVAAGAGMMGAAFPGEVSRAAVVVAPGLMVLTIILFMGKVSGATSTRWSASPSRCAGTSPGAASPATSSSSWPGPSWPPGSSRASSTSRRPTAGTPRRRAIPPATPS